jgi:hypothetical protein
MHVEANINNYDSLLTNLSIKKVQHNELLYSLEYAPNLFRKWHPRSVLVALDEGFDTWDFMAVITAKSENTKPATKVRYYYRTNIHV